MNEPLTITLPLPDPKLSPNARVHWRVLADAKKAYKWTADAASFAAWVCNREGPLPKWEKADYILRFYFSCKRRRDDDNLIASMKSAIDGIVKSGILADDDQLKLRGVDKLIDKDKPRVELIITPTA